MNLIKIENKHSSIKLTLEIWSICADFQLFWNLCQVDILKWKKYVDLFIKQLNVQRVFHWKRSCTHPFKFVQFYIEFRPMVGGLPLDSSLPLDAEGGGLWGGGQEASPSQVIGDINF